MAIANALRTNSIVVRLERFLPNYFVLLWFDMIAKSQRMERKLNVGRYLNANYEHDWRGSSTDLFVAKKIKAKSTSLVYR